MLRCSTKINKQMNKKEDENTNARTQTQLKKNLLSRGEGEQQLGRSL